MKQSIDLAEEEKEISIKLEPPLPHLPQDNLFEKMIADMDDLSAEQKAASISFSTTMTTMEGVPISDSLRKSMSDWQEGTQSFDALLDTTLKSHGFKGK